MPATLDHLPVEILHMILAHLGIDCRYTDQLEPPDTPHRFSQTPDQPSWYSLKLQPLLSLCLVSKRLCNVFQPILYQEFMLGCGDSWCSELYTWDGRLLSFLRTVARRRDLAGFVKRIRIVPHLLQASCEYLEKKERDRHGIWKERGARYQMLDGKILTSPVPPQIDMSRPMTSNCHGLWTEAIPSEGPELRIFILEEEAHDTLHELAVALGIKKPEQLSAKHLITLLIAALPKLEHCSLLVGPYRDKMCSHSGPLSAAGISRLPLRTLNVGFLLKKHEDFELDCTVRALLEVSPCLETLNLHRCNGTGQQVALPFLPSLKHIRIVCSRLNEQALDNILNSCDSLCNFVYEAKKPFFNPSNGLPENEWDCSDHFQLCNAAGYLSRHYKTLESVHIDLRYRGGDPAVPSSFSFRELTALKHLFLNLDEFHSRFFMPRCTDEQILVQILPSGISSLHLAGQIGEDLPRLEKSLLGLAEAAIEGQFKNLKEVRWDRAAKLNAENVVMSLFADAGVDFAYDSWPGTSLSFYESASIPPLANFKNPWLAFLESVEEDTRDL
ncbi:uncharacterized protein N7515_007140 [Penicillium bovifimosum]|uniref:F-box domain-containing protein n=1 Tax=Penicillium bovifimosum TaxID=126998 RepID=A0A9W9GW92_9EURO|nr:uncharacterized protein N7515_007140 [Penicillium bovifimosum]KAJ5131101.1 hypothetical protein N7515_007140 [Penicillium bovifimosum]